MSSSGKRRKIISRTSLLLRATDWLVGYTRAARLVDTLEERGIIGPQQMGSQVREVLDYGDQPSAAPPEEDAS